MIMSSEDLDITSLHLWTGQTCTKEDFKIDLDSICQSLKNKLCDCLYLYL